MKRISNRRITTLASSAALLTLLGACTEKLEQPATDFNNELVTSFINRFGLPDPNHDWSMAATAGLKVKSSTPVDLRVYAQIDGQTYLFADLVGFEGNNPVPVIIPKSVSRLILEVNDTERYICGTEDTVDLDALRSAPRSRDYIELDRTEPAEGAAAGKNNWENITTNEIDGRVLKYDIADNQALLQIIENPFESEYLHYDEYDTDDGRHVKDPLMPSISGIQICKKDAEMHQPIDYEFMPVYVRSEQPGNTNAEFEMRATTYYTIIDDISYNSVSNALDFGESNTYNIGYVNGNDIVGVTNPTASNATWVGKTIKVSTKENKVDEVPYGLYYYIKRGDNGQLAGTKKVTSSSVSWDTEIGGPSDAYSSCLYFDGVPFTYYVNDTEKKTDYVYVYGIYEAPTKLAQTRPDKPTAYIIEFYDTETLGHVTWFPVKSNEYSFRLMTEDLGSTDDWDFNDLVVDVTAVLTNLAPIFSDGHALHETTKDYYVDKWLTTNIGQESVYKVTVTPRAAGGILPLYLGYFGKLFTSAADITPLNGMKVSEIMKMSEEELQAYKPTSLQGNYQIYKEIHDWFGVNSTSTMINTKTIDYSGKTVEFYTSSFYKTHFFTIVDKDNELSAQPVSGMDYSLIDESDKAYQENISASVIQSDERKLIPQTIFLTTDFPWAIEKTNFGEAYPEFSEWVGNSRYGLGWYTSRKPELVVE